MPLGIKLCKGETCQCVLPCLSMLCVHFSVCGDERFNSVLVILQPSGNRVTTVQVLSEQLPSFVLVCVPGHKRRQWCVPALAPPFPPLCSLTDLLWSASLNQ